MMDETVLTPEDGPLFEWLTRNENIFSVSQKGGNSTETKERGKRISFADLVLLLLWRHKLTLGNQVTSKINRNFQFYLCNILSVCLGVALTINCLTHPNYI